MKRDLAFGIAGAVIAAGYSWLAARIPESALADAVGPGGLPIAYAVVLLLLSLILIARSLRAVNHKPRTPDPGSRIPDPVFGLFRVAGMLAIGAAYIVLVSWLGYTVTVAGLLVAVTYYLGGIVNRSVALVAVSGAVVFWLLFVQVLGISHPAGIWARFF